MLKSILNGVGGGFGRIIGKFIGLALIGLLAYYFISSRNIEIKKVIPRLDEVIPYE